MYISKNRLNLSLILFRFLAAKTKFIIRGQLFFGIRIFLLRNIEEIVAQWHEVCLIWNVQRVIQYSRNIPRNCADLPSSNKTRSKIRDDSHYLLCRLTYLRGSIFIDSEVWKKRFLFRQFHRHRETCYRWLDYGIDYSIVKLEKAH